MAIFKGTILVLLLALSSTQSRPGTHEKTALSETKPTNSKKATSGSHLVEPKGSATQKFETAHKLPSSLAHLISLEEQEDEEAVKKHSVRRRDAPAPAPAGSIRLDPKKLIEKYKHELKTSTTTAKTRASTKTSKRTKKETRPEDAPVHEPTSPRPSLTSGAPITARTLDIHNTHLVGSGSEKQRSRIQIKKGPNGQEYEYEYVYYYYDDDEDKDKSGAAVSNSHDGPQPNQIPTDSKKTDKAIFNEVLPASRERTRGRQLEDEDVVGEERLPANTRFPPRSRNLATTPLPEEEAGKARGRPRGRPTTQSPDSNSDESQSKSRTRANVRRPSLDLVDSASFNTHQGAAGAEPPVGGPSFPSDLPAGPVRFLGATPNERIDLQESSPQAPESPVPSPSPALAAAEEKKGATPAAPVGEEVSSATTGMDKVALDLYAISQGTQKLSGEEPSSNASQEPESTPELTTDPATTEPEASSSSTTSTTTTTTTTTTTQAPSTTTTTTEAPAGFVRGRFRGRGSVKKSPIAASTTTEAAADGKSKNRFGRPSFGSRPRHGGAAARTTAEPSHESSESHKEEGKPAGRARPTLSRRFGTTRSKPSSTEASNEQEEQSHSSTPRATLTRPRPSFNLRSRGRSTTTAPDSEGSPQDSSPSEDGASSTTARSRARLPASPGARPLRPGPRINLARGRPGSSTAAPPEGAQEEATSERSPDAEDAKEAESSPAPAEDKSPLSRLRNRPKLNPSAQPRAKAAASSPVQVRRINPLLNRRRPGPPEASSSEAPPESPATEETDAPEEEEETSDSESSAPSSSTTTEEPKGLNKLLAGRRRLIARQPGTIN